jgi:hypothetical protein
MAINAVITSIKFTLQKPGHVTLFKGTMANGFERLGPGQEFIGKLYSRIRETMNKPMVDNTFLFIIHDSATYIAEKLVGLLNGFFPHCLVLVKRVDKRSWALGWI